MIEQNWNESLEEMIKAGVHVGHQNRKCNTKMTPYIFTEIKGIYIIDIIQTERLLFEACKFVTKAAIKGEQFLLVGTRYQTSRLVASVANQMQCHYVNTTWFSGMLTNWSTIETRLKKFKQLEMQEAAGNFNWLPKKEAAVLKRQLAQLSKYLYGIKSITKLPDVVILIDQHQDVTAIQECIKLGIPTICLVDTDCDPDLVDMPIPANDDARSSIHWILKKLILSILKGRQKRQKIISIENMTSIKKVTSDKILVSV